MPPIDEELESKEEELEVEDANPDEANESEAENDENIEDGANEESAEESEDSDDDSETPEFERRFTQFKGETLEEYVKNLEEGYANSSTEAVRLNRELRKLRDEKMADIANPNEEGEDKPKEDPALVYARQKMEEDAAKDYRTFAEQHPEIDELSDQFDEKLFEDFDREAGYARDYLYRTTGKIPTLMEAMTRAWAVMHPDVITREEKIAMNAKTTAAGAKSKSVSKEKPSPRFSDAQIEAAKKMDPKLENKTRAEIEEILSKYVK